MNNYQMYGANYYPLVEAEENWERDLLKMKQAHIHYIRTAEIFNGWDTLEPSKGVYQFDALKRFFKVCHKVGIQVLLGTGSNSAPYWLHLEDPTVNIESHNGQRFPNHGTYGWACYQHPLMKKYSRQYLTKLIETFKDEPALMGYQINNEIGYPFMPGASGQLEVYCYCAHCTKGFQTWLKAKYKTLEALGYAWRWSTTSAVYTSFEHIAPPRIKPSSWSSVTRFLDWRLYQMDVITAQIQSEHDLIKALDPHHIDVTNIFYMKSQDPLGTITAIDNFEIAKICDVIGYDLYPGSGDKLNKMPEFSSMFLAHGRSVAACANKKLWLSEVEGGPIGGWVLGPDRNTDGIDITHNQMQALGNGVTSMLYQLYKESAFQPLHWGGVVDFNGEVTPRYEAVQKIGLFIEHSKTFFKEATTMTSKVAILVDKHNEIVLTGIDQAAFYLAEMRGIYQYYYEQGYQVDYLNEDNFKAHAYKYKIIHAPMLAVVKPTLPPLIQAYMAQGGLFIASARLGYMDENGWAAHCMPHAGLDKILGFKTEAVEAGVEPVISYHKKAYKGYHHQELLTDLAADVEVIAYFQDETPAIISRKIGQGGMLYFATHIGQERRQTKTYLFDTVMHDIRRHGELEPTIKLAYAGDHARVIESYIVKNDTEAMLILTAFTNKQGRYKKQKVHLTIESTRPLKIYDKTSKEYIPSCFQDNKVVFEIIFTWGEASCFKVTYDE